MCLASTWPGPHLQLSAVVCYRSISPACGALSSKPAARRGCCYRSMGQTDGQTDARPFHRICCVHYAGSVDKDLKYELAMQDAIRCFDWLLTIVPRTCVQCTSHSTQNRFGCFANHVSLASGLVLTFSPNLCSHISDMSLLFIKGYTWLELTCLAVSLTSVFKRL